MGDQRIAVGVATGTDTGLQRIAGGGRDPHDHTTRTSSDPPSASSIGSSRASSILNDCSTRYACEHCAVKVILRNPRREIELSGPRTVINLLAALDLNREAHLVMRDGELIPGDAALDDSDVIEVRPVISGGSQ